MKRAKIENPDLELARRRLAQARGRCADERWVWGTATRLSAARLDDALRRVAYLEGRGA